MIIGGGAAGMFCAANAAKHLPKGQVVVLEKGLKLMQKVKVSGGGRCNVTHDAENNRHLISNYPPSQSFLKKAFSHFNHNDTVAWFKERGVPLKVEADGRMFPTTNSSQTIMDCLLGEAQQYGVEIFHGFDVASIKKHDGAFEVTSGAGRTFHARSVCVACGGMHKPAAFTWLTEHFGLEIIPPVPSLFTFNAGNHALTALAGVSTQVILRLSGTTLQSQGPLLITHWGVSGPAVLRLSAFAARILHTSNYEYTAIINWLPAFNETSLLQHMHNYRQYMGHALVAAAEWMLLPQRLKLFLLQQAGIESSTTWATLKATQQNALAKTLCSFVLPCKGKTTFKEEFVTAGGVSTATIDPNTMQSRKVSGLFFAGEVMDVDGVTGGFNFQHAWTSGYLAAKAVVAMHAAND